MAYIGKVPDLGTGNYLGVILDEPLGNSNGSVNGVKYFETYNKYGLFQWRDDLEIGDYPPIDEFNEI